MNNSTATVGIGSTNRVTLIATVNPSNATNKAVTWSSSNTAVATVVNGTVTGVIAGKATITVTTKDGNFTANCVVTVEDGFIPVTGVSLNTNILNRTIVNGISSSEKLNLTISPPDATNKDVTWSSSDPEVATVDQDGNVTMVSEGTATITVTTEDGNFEAICSVIVSVFNLSHNSLKVINRSRNWHSVDLRTSSAGINQVEHTLIVIGRIYPDDFFILAAGSANGANGDSWGKYIFADNEGIFTIEEDIPWTADEFYMPRLDTNVRIGNVSTMTPTYHIYEIILTEKESGTVVYKLSEDPDIQDNPSNSELLLQEGGGGTTWLQGALGGSSPEANIEINIWDN